MNHFHTKKLTVSTFLAVMALIAIGLMFLPVEKETANAGGGEGECSSCHPGIRLYALESAVPSEVGENGSFSYGLTIVNHDGNDGNPFDLLDIQLELVISGENVTLAPGEDATKTTADMIGPGTAEVSWRLEAVSPGNASVGVLAAGTAHYDHKKDNYPDDYRYDRETGLADIVVKHLALVFSDYSFSVMEGGAGEFDLIITATENITGFTAWIPGSLAGILKVNSSHAEWTGNGFANMTEGEERVLTFNLSGVCAASGDVILSWNDSRGNLESIRIRFTVTGKSEGGEKELGLRSISRLLGYVSLVMLLSLFVSGCRSPKVKRFMNRVCGCAKNRLRLHCWVSYGALVTGLVHGLIWMERQDTLYLDNNEVLLGDIAVIFMAAVALNGIFQKRIVKRYDFRRWHMIHLWGSVAALVTAVLHTLKLNTILGFGL